VKRQALGHRWRALLALALLAALAWLWWRVGTSVLLGNLNALIC